MYELTVDLPKNRDPWLIPLEKRMLDLYRAKGKILIAIYDRPDTSTFRYRIYNVWQTLQESEEWSFHYFYEEELDIVKNELEKASMLLLSRTKWTLNVQNIVNLARNYQLPVIFDVDDRIYDLDMLQLASNTLNVQLKFQNEYDFWAAYISRIYMSACLADGFTCTNPYLGKCLQDKFGKPFVCVENSLNKEQLKVSSDLVKLKEKSKNNSDYVLGYFSGTPSHINDFKVIAPEIVRLLNEYENMKLLVVGFMEFPPDMRPLLESEKIMTHPLVDFLELQIQMAQVDLNVVPLVNNGFTNCKSELKFFESAIVDVPTCATPIYTYANSIQDKKTGFLCNRGEWYSTISDIYNGKYDLKKMNQEAKQYAISRYSGENFRKKVETAYTTIFNTLKQK